jgi:ribosome-binding factor A
MPSRRQAQVNSVIEQTLSRIIQEQIELPHGSLFTLTRVEASPSLEHADVYISVLPDNRRLEVLQWLQRHVYHLQQQLDKEVVLKFVPKIRFQIDEGAVAENEINTLLDSLPKSESEDS